MNRSRLVLVFLLFLGICGIASASDYVRGDNGYYFKPGHTQAYERYVEYDWMPGYYKYDSHLCKYVWVAGYWQGRYAYKAVKLDIYAEDFPTKALAVVAARDKLILTSQANLALADKLGLNAHIPNYGVGVFPYPLRSYGHQYYQPAQVQAVDIYGDKLDYDAAVQAIAQLTGRSMDLTEKIAPYVGAPVASYERVQIAREQGRTRVGLAKALAPNSAHVETTQVGPVQLRGSIDAPVRAAVRVAAANTCVACHAGDGANVKAFDITKYDPATADAETVERVFRYIRPGGGDRHCPPGKQLTAAQINELTLPGKDGAQ